LQLAEERPLVGLGGGGGQLLDRRSQRGHGFVQVVEVGQELSGQQPVLVAAAPADQASRWCWQLAREPALG
jgi:hypothetical protein